MILRETRVDGVVMALWLVEGKKTLLLSVKKDQQEAYRVPNGEGRNRIALDHDTVLDDEP